MVKKPRLVAYRGKWCAVIWDDGKRSRVSLGNIDATEEGHPIAERAFAELEKELAKPIGDTLADIFSAYRADTDALDVERMDNAWKALEPFFGSLKPEHITRNKCRQYAKDRAAASRKAGTIRKELSVLRAAVNWAGKGSLSVFDFPSPPPPKDRWLTKIEFEALLEASRITYHLTVFLHLAIATAGRKEAILSLRWTQVRWDLNQIELGLKEGGKARAIVPMTHSVRAVLQQAKMLAKTDFVVEFEGSPVKNIKRAFNSAVVRAGLGKDVTPHVLRHTAAVWMAANRVPMSEISQFLGHSDSRITEKIYARYSPDHLRDAAKSLNVGQFSAVQ